MIRRLVPLVLLISGTGSIVYGVRWHAVPVLVDAPVEIEKMIAPPRPPAPPFMGGPPGSRGPGRNMPPFMPPPPPQKVRVKTIETQLHSKPEAQVVREITVGGITRLADGQLKLTYALGQAGPALCPT